jgi:Xaa-Pro aminopeptidase
MQTVLGKASKIHQTPLIGRIFRPRLKNYTHEDLQGFRQTQKLAHQCAQEIAKLLRPGQSEIQVANMMDQWQRDHGVKNFLHRPFAWFGNRTRFDDCPSYTYFLPSKRTLKDNDVVILDTAPVLNGYPADIGYAHLMGGENPEFHRSIDSLKQYRNLLPRLFETPGITGVDIYQNMEQTLKNDGYENIHARYPLGVLGHRMHPMIDGVVPGMLLPFSWQFYWAVFSRGAFSETLGNFHSGDLDGLWAIEPHIGVKGQNAFGVKFEEMLYVKNGKAQWLVDQGVFCE